MQIIGSSVLSISLITGVAGAASANVNTVSEVGTEDNIFTCMQSKKYAELGFNQKHHC